MSKSATCLPAPCVVLHKYRAIYVKVHKAACTTILNRIARTLWSDSGKSWNPDNADVVHTRQAEIFNTKSSAVFHNFDAAKSHYPNYFSFTVVRDPFSRIKSCYKDKILGPRPFTPIMLQEFPQLWRGMTFSEFLARVALIPVPEMDPHFRPQNTFFDDRIDFVGRLETFEDDWREITGRVGMPQVGSEVLNKTAPSRAITMSPPVQQLIREIYARDFNVLGYPDTVDDAPTESAPASGSTVYCGHDLEAAARFAPVLFQANRSTIDAEARSDSAHNRFIFLKKNPFDFVLDHSTPDFDDIPQRCEDWNRIARAGLALREASANVVFLDRNECADNPKAFSLALLDFLQTPLFRKDDVASALSDSPEVAPLPSDLPPEIRKLISKLCGQYLLPFDYLPMLDCYLKTQNLNKWCAATSRPFGSLTKLHANSSGEPIPQIRYLGIPFATPGVLESIAMCNPNGNGVILEIAVGSGDSVLKTVRSTLSPGKNAVSIAVPTGLKAGFLQLAVEPKSGENAHFSSGVQIKPWKMRQLRR